MKQYDKDAKAIGKKLKQLRGIRTRIGVSHETGIPYSTLQSYEDGRRMPSTANMKRLADYYRVPLESIFCTRE